MSLKTILISWCEIVWNEQLFLTVIFAGYKKRPEVKYYFHRGNKENNFEIITRDENNGVFAYIRNRNRIKGPRIFYLEFRGDVVDNGTLASRFVHRMYVFVSRYDF